MTFLAELTILSRLKVWWYKVWLVEASLDVRN